MEFLCLFSWRHDFRLFAKPNIVLIVADYMGYADIEPFGHTEIKTPSLKRLASEGKLNTLIFMGPIRYAVHPGVHY